MAAFPPKWCRGSTLQGLDIYRSAVILLPQVALFSAKFGDVALRDYF
jgi:hypothetical protein